MGTGTGQAAATAAKWSMNTLRNTGQAVGAIVIIIGLAWGIGRPGINQFIQDAVAGNLKTLELTVKEAKTRQWQYKADTDRKLQEQKINAAVQTEKLRKIEEGQKETRRDIKEILRLMRTR
jgi:hypothetical protein